jgi:hypothetical protein
VTGIKVVNKTFDAAVQVSQVSPTGFTFTTLPGHVQYPATISFAASPSGSGHVNFAINVNGVFANKQAEVAIAVERGADGSKPDGRPTGDK